jgi:hypothetical protein
MALSFLRKKRGQPITHQDINALQVGVESTLQDVAVNYPDSGSATLVSNTGNVLTRALRLATSSLSGLLSAADKSKLDALAMYNLLDNPGFEIKQRTAATFTTSGTVTLDRWILLLGGTSTATISQIASTIGYAGKSAQIAYTHAAGGYAILYQNVEEYAQFIGNPVSFAVTVKASAASRVHLYLSDGVTATYSSYNVGTGAERLSVTATPGVGTTALVASILVDVASCTVEANDATLVVGSYPAQFSPLNAADDMGRCERYYQILLCTARFSASAALQTVETPLTHRVRMAGTPTATLQSDGSAANQNAGSPATANVTDRGGRFIITSATTGDCYVIVRSLVLEYNP